MKWQKKALSIAAVTAAVVATASIAPPADGATFAPDEYIFQLMNAHSGLCLVGRVSQGEVPVVEVPCAGYADQYWTFVQVAVGAYQIENVWTGRCIVTRGDGESGAVATTCDATYGDQWWWYDTPDGVVYHFMNGNSALCLAARGSIPETQAIQTTCGEQWADQKWISIPE